MVSLNFIIFLCADVNLSLLQYSTAEKVHAGHIDGIRFYLSTKSIEHVEPNISEAAVFGDLFDPKRNTKILIHGFMDNYAHGTFIPRVRSAYLKALDVNVIGVDWSWWMSDDYVKITGIFIRVVAKRVASLIKMLVEQYETDLSKIHLIGHSLGAHVSGLVGLLISNYIDGKKLGRITGIDPAGEGFLGKELKLTKLCAEFVDAIHTDDYGFGLPEANAHLDFYVNGGHSQAACGTMPGACSHNMAHHYWEHAVLNRTAFLAVKCDSWLSFTMDLCCKNEKTYLGEDTSTKARGHFYLATSKEPPYGLGKDGVRVPRMSSIFHFIYAPDPSLDCTQGVIHIDA